MQSANKRLIWIIFATIVLVQFAVFVGLKYVDSHVADLDGDTRYAYPIHGQDSPEFYALGESFLSKHAFTLTGLYPETFRTPGYPFLIFLSLQIFKSLNALIVFQILLSGLMGVLIFLMGREFYSNKWAIAAALVFCLLPSTIFHSVVVLSEIPFVFLLLLSVYAVFFERGSMKAMFIGGLALGLSALVRPVSLYLPLLYVLIVVLSQWGRAERKRAMKQAAFILLGFCIAVAPWYARNKIETGVLGFSSITTYNLAEYNMRDFLTEKYGADSTISHEYNSRIDSIPQDVARTLAGGAELKAVMTPYLKANFFSYAYFHVVTTAKFFFSSSLRYLAIYIKVPGVQSFFGLSGTSPDLLHELRHGHIGIALEALRQQSLITVDRLLTIIVILLALSSVLVKSRRFYVLLLLSFVIYFAILTGPVSIPRYRLPVEPFIVILACYTLSNWSKSWRTNPSSIAS